MPPLKLMSMRKFTRSGWVGLTAPVRLTVGDDEIGLFIPAVHEPGEVRGAPRAVDLSAFTAEERTRILAALTPEQRAAILRGGGG